MSESTQFGIRNNLFQFMLLVFINGLVGCLIGLERTIIPEFALQRFGLDGHGALLSFIIVFGLSKSFTNYFTGKIAERIGKNRVLITGWLIALPIPILMIYGEYWWLILVANILLGVNQGLTWSIAVMMKIDIAGKKDRGFAMGLNESAGYLCVALMAFLTSYLSETYGVHPYPFYPGLFIVILALGLSIGFVKDTSHFVQKESQESTHPLLSRIFRDTTISHPSLRSVTQGGLINNFNDGVIWGLLPIYLTGLDFTLMEVGIIGGLYPAIWGLGQLVTGKLSDHYDKKYLMTLGMILQGIGIIGFTMPSSFILYCSFSILIGIGTALVYPTFLSAISAHSHPSQRSEIIGVYRLWRDLGYVFGALGSILLLSFISMSYTLIFVGIITFLSGWIIWNQFETSEEI